MLYKLGRFLQLLGLLVLPVGVAGNIARPEMVGVRGTLAIASAGIAVFTAGWALQQLSR
jgi:hypothetical protein